MRLEAFWTKWQTNRLEKKVVTIANAVAPHNTIEVTVRKCSAPLGELIKEYTLHLSIPWWRKHSDWKSVEQKLRERLDSIASVEWDQ